MVSHAQLTQLSEPVSWDVDETLATTLSFNELDEVNVAELLLEDEEATEFKDLPLRFATKQEVEFSIENSGRWTTLPNGDRIWMLGLRSAEAKALSVTFDEFFIPEGAVMHLYNADRSFYVGGYTNENNKIDGTFTTQAIPGEDLIIEYYEPYVVRHDGRLSIRTVAHSYRTLDSAINSEDPNFTCLPNVACDDNPSLRDQASSVVLITLDDGTRWATGTLVNNANFDGKPYILTGDHCLWGDPSSWLFTFRFLSSECDQVVEGQRLKAISGADIVTTDIDASIALLELSARPLPEWNVYYAGWDASGATPQKVKTVHHPKGAVKKVTSSEIAPQQSVWKGVTVFEVAGWDSGTTLDGSTGAPMIDEHGRVCGVLFGGENTCSNNESDYFCKLSEAWGDLAKYLNPFNQPIILLDGTYLRFGDVDAQVFQNNVAIFPNPASTAFNILNEGDQAIRTISIIDLSGRIVKQMPYTGMTVDVSELPIGQYVVEVQFAIGVNRQKLMIWK